MSPLKRWTSRIASPAMAALAMFAAGSLLQALLGTVQRTIDSLKVDRSFVRNLRSGSKESTVVRAIVHLSNSLGKRVIAEGIETPSQFAQLREMGCQMGQGFHLSRPLASDAVELLLAHTLAGVLPATHRTALDRAVLYH